jgi:tetratricopeptide (TPR) repeat protein
MTSNLDIILDEAFSFYNAGQFDQAEDLTRQVLSAEPNHGDALFLLGLIAFQSDALEPASDILFQAVKLYPNIENYTMTLASVLQKQERLAEALTYYEKFPNNPQGLAQRGFIYLLKNQQDFAKSAFKKALEYCPDLAEASLGMALLEDDLTSLEKTAKTSNIPDAWYYLGRACHKLERNDEAIAAYTKVVELVPGTERATNSTTYINRLSN